MGGKNGRKNSLSRPRLATSTSPKAEVMNFLIKGDYGHYNAMKPQIPDRKSYVRTTLNSYGHAWRVAQEGLEPSDPIRLQLALKYAAASREFRKNPDYGCHLGKYALETGVVALMKRKDNLELEDYEERLRLLEKLRDYLLAWTDSE
ncbi:hypothetical protein M422DRAFT_773867 [Sphaerobolus stellatus SS14]|nr:hypothetical protein M422DRAFT_773867 [Sphaerobolus stellatus SS14]